jgi:CubicO group peptidase (beta-lactamase class C family)
LKNRINSAYSDWLIQRLNEEAITLLKNKNDAVPLKQLGENKIALLSIGVSKKSSFQKTLALYGGFDSFQIEENATEAQAAQIFKKLKNYDGVICGIHSAKIADSAGLTSLCAQKKVHFCFFISPYKIRLFEKSLASAESVTLAYENTEAAQKAAAQVIMGGLPAKGKLPVTIPSFDYGAGLATQKVRLSYQSPKEAGMSETGLNRIEEIVKEGISKQAFPGCQVLVAKNGIVVYNKSFGYFDYANTHPVQTTDVYDLASVTKIMATVPAIMKMYDTKKIGLEDRLSKYIPELKNTDKSDISIREALFHQTGLVSFLPFYTALIDTSTYKGPLYSTKRTMTYSIEYDKNTYVRSDFKFLPDKVSTTSKKGISKQVAEHFFVADDINQTVIQAIADSKLRKNKNYLYSDLNFILLKEVVENISKQTLNVFLEKEFYAGLGADHTLFLPLTKMDKEIIAPTENDEFLRNQILIGHVHDEAAAVLGGVSGNAGLFSNANDMAKIGQLFLNAGTYGGERYWGEATVKLFTQTQSPFSRRGLGFDKPDEKKMNPLVSSGTYGHTGYTGTCIWIDPDNKLVYIFLSNRVYPSRRHTQLMELNIRNRIQEIIYDSLR